MQHQKVRLYRKHTPGYLRQGDASQDRQEEVRAVIIL